ncbi:hypothetical protein QA639_30015 [Bradyrhizobium pachyrhizi]|uniref:hypothetical protein n=1 Tax=Bradyrhizobium pachyrhizi TaxID=280333 RepID=UPI0024B0DCE3|nr:hypothetical protein [Bradyrhizobium pachyrhizi]WFU53870.1 hypothetical protein QA639_30015 [Bradyrhizobium pachyrhizi]
MPLPGNHTLNTEHLTVYTPSCGASPVAAYIRVPFRCRVLKATGILGGAITTADGTITVAANGNTLTTFAVPQAGSAAGQLFSAVPASPTYLNEDDVIVLTPSGASGAAVPMHFSLSVRTA